MITRRHFLHSVAAALSVPLVGGIHRPVMASETARDCLLIWDWNDDRTITRDGPCDQRFSPCSTFKVPLALMGFDAAILKDIDNPRLVYDGRFPAPARDRKAVDPTIWLRDSVVWYSRVLTAELGMARFQNYVDALDYGNRDLTGTPGKSDGLTQAWLMSSLQISPDEQVRFLSRLLRGQVPVSARAQAMTIASLPTFTLDGGWRVVGKTGGGWRVRPDGSADESAAQGWFVGWAERDGRKVVFARLHVSPRLLTDPVGPGPAARQLALGDLTEILNR